MAEYTGDYKKHTDGGATVSSYYTYLPKPLASTGLFTLDEEWLSLISQTYRLLGHLEGAASLLNDGDIREFLLYKEAYYSRLIDYPGDDLYTFLCLGQEEGLHNSINSIVAAYKYSSSRSITRDNTSAVGRVALYGLESTEKLGIRCWPMFLSGISTNLKVYNPTHPDDLPKALANLYNFYNDNHIEVLAKTAVGHYQFEMIHPYERYNGVIGRVLNVQALMNANIMAAEYLCLSKQLYIHRNVYFSMLSETRKSGDYTAWITFYLSLVNRAAQQRVKQIRSFQDLVKHDEEVIKAGKLSTNTIWLLYNHFKRHVVSDIKELMQTHKLAYNTIDYSLKALIDMGIIAQVSEGIRRRRFAHIELANLLLGDG